MERYITEHGIERNENFKENGALRVGENDYHANQLAARVLKLRSTALKVDLKGAV